MSGVTTTKIGDGIEVLIEGLPLSVISPVAQARTALTLLAHGIPKVGGITAGILGGIREATIKVGSEYYKLKYSIKVLRPLTAIEVYSLAITYVKQGTQDGTFDEKLAETFLAWIQQEFDNEFQLNKNNKGDIESKLLDMK